MVPILAGVILAGVIWSSLPRVDAVNPAPEALPRTVLASRDPSANPAAGDATIAPAALGRGELLVEGEIARGAFPGAAVAVGGRSRTDLLAGLGKIGWTAAARPVDPRSTLYDLASLTKVVAMTTAVALLVDDGRMQLDAPVSRWLPDFTGGGRERVTLRHLLTHTSGLPAGTVLRGRTVAERLRSLMRTPIYFSPGTHVEYSDLGAILLWKAAERAAGEPLPEFLRRRLFLPLGMHHTRFQPGLDCEACAPTGRLRDQSLYRGQPFDATARTFGGVTGSAGLFSTAADLARFAAMISSGGELDGVRVLRAATVREFLHPQPGAGTRALGWESFCREGTVPDQHPCAEVLAVGHTGFTGTSLWIDPGRGVWVVLLTNRTYEPRAENHIVQLRRELWKAVTSPTSPAPGPAPSDRPPSPPESSPALVPPASPVAR